MQDTDWIQIKMRTGSKLADTAANLLEQLGAIAVSYTDAEDSPILEPKPGERRLWPATEVTGLLPQGTDPQPILDTLKAILGDHLPMMFTRLEDKNWIRAWMDQFKPLKFGRHLWICPSWLKVEEKDAIVVMLDPGLAFGTGTHPTTSLCLSFLDSLDFKNKKVLDYGCGSGILAIAALKLGAQCATGIDIDEQAIEASKENAVRNNVAEKLSLNIGSKNIPEGNFAITVANILAGPLAELEPDIARLTASGGKLALSGILVEQAQEVIDAYSADFHEMKLEQSKEGWALLTGTRK